LSLGAVAQLGERLNGIQARNNRQVPEFTPFFLLSQPLSRLFCFGMFPWFYTVFDMPVLRFYYVLKGMFRTAQGHP
jgi:hypothetical protein